MPYGIGIDVELALMGAVFASVRDEEFNLAINKAATLAARNGNKELAIKIRKLRK